MSSRHDDRAPVSATHCSYCGDLAWTTTARAQNGGRITHKHACPHRTDNHCQTHPTGCAPMNGGTRA